MSLLRPSARPGTSAVEPRAMRAHHGGVSQPQPERTPDVEPTDEPVPDAVYEAWRDLQDVLEERDREYWAGTYADDEA